MADIFISYASADRQRASQIAEILISRGWSVWWDRKINFGESWDEAIEREIDAASCIIVLWSKNSVQSTWVRNEAREAKARGILVPALIEDARLPLEFRHQQTANLVNWQPELRQPEFEKLLIELTDMLTPSASTTAPPPDNELPTRKSPKVPARGHGAAQHAATRSRSKSAVSTMGSVTGDASKVTRAWRATLAESGWSSRKLNISLTNENHVVFYSNHHASQTVEVDGHMAAKGGTAVTFARKFKFELSDGAAKHSAILEVDSSYLILTTKGLRLTVAGQMLYHEGTL